MSEVAMAPLYERENLAPGIVLVRYDNPPVNALPGRAYGELVDVMTALEAEDDVRAIVLTSAGTRVFCAGQDTREIRAYDRRRSEQRKANIVRAMTALRMLNTPLVVALNGPVVGAGVMLVSLADVIVAAEHASLKLAEIDVGVVGGSRHAMRVLPLPVVRRMTLTATPLSAQEALRFGAVAEVVASDDLLATAQSFAEALAGKDPRAMTATKSAMREIESVDLDTGWDIERGLSAQLEPLIHADAGEGV